MNEIVQAVTILRLQVELAAMRNAWKNKCCFTVRSFCEKYGFKDTRYLRSILKGMVAAGDLYSFKGRGGESREKLYFCAQQTDMMQIFEENLK